MVRDFQWDSAGFSKVIFSFILISKPTPSFSAFYCNAHASDGWGPECWSWSVCLCGERLCLLSEEGEWAWLCFKHSNGASCLHIPLKQQMRHLLCTTLSSNACFGFSSMQEHKLWEDSSVWELKTSFSENQLAGRCLWGEFSPSRLEEDSELSRDSSRLAVSHSNPRFHAGMYIFNTIMLQLMVDWEVREKQSVLEGIKHTNSFEDTSPISPFNKEAILFLTGERQQRQGLSLSLSLL